MEQANRRPDICECAEPDQSSPHDAISREERVAWVRLIRTEAIGRNRFHKLLDHFGTALNAIESLPQITSGPLSNIKLCSLKAAEMELEKTEKYGAKIITLRDNEYPPLLKNIYNPPPVLYIKGDTSLVHRPIISIVGSRNGSAAGQKITETIARDLAELGYVIASGLARGIDTAAHKASIATGTIAVVAGGADMLYPPENADLQTSIGETGLLISENPIGFKPRGKDFPRRNRIISGIAHAVLVIEAALKSGSLITARYALEHNREIFAVPGNPLDPRAAGTNSLLMKGANMLTCASDVTEVLAPMMRSLQSSTQEKPGDSTRLPGIASSSEAPTTDRQKVLLAMGPTPTSIDELVRCTGLNSAVIQSILLELDLSGRLERHGRQQVSLVTPGEQGRLFD